MYTKPHLPYENQLDLLISRGLIVPDRLRGVALLRAVGYYRLSAYVYPFRVLLPQSERPRATPFQFRGDDLVPGVTLDHVESLWRFDKLLRARALDGLESLEVGLRTQVAHVLGARDPFGHTARTALDPGACDQPSSGRVGEGLTAFEAWTMRYEELQTAAKGEDYVRHHLMKYGRPLPIWVAAEFLDFGALSRLYELLDRRDQNQVAVELGLSAGSGRLLQRWLGSLVYLRNIAAHHARVWNRAMTRTVGGFSPNQVGDLLRHAAQPDGSGDRIYRHLAVMAYLVRHIDPETRWHVNLSETIKKFPQVPGLSPQLDMGFPTGWQSMGLWTLTPKARPDRQA